jgi:hypothetical protein
MTASLDESNRSRSAPAVSAAPSLNGLRLFVEDDGISAWGGQFGKLNVAVGVSTELCVPSKKTLSISAGQLRRFVGGALDPATGFAALHLFSSTLEPCEP